MSELQVTNRVTPISGKNKTVMIWASYINKTGRITRAEADTEILSTPSKNQLISSR